MIFRSFFCLTCTLSVWAETFCIRNTPSSVFKNKVAILFIYLIYDFSFCGVDDVVIGLKGLDT